METPKATPLVSVIMNCFNGDRYVNEAIDSVYAQSYRNWEIVFWDNASSDSSATIARGFDERLRYFRSEQHCSLGGARQMALNQTRGELIAFLDADDIWLPDKLERQVSAMLNADYALCYTGTIEIDGSGKLIRTLLPMYKAGPMFGQQLAQFDISPTAAMIRKSKLDSLEPAFDNRLFASEEYFLFIRLAARYPFCTIETPLVKRRIHDGSLSARTLEKWAGERELTLDTIRKEIPGIENRFSGEFKEAYARADYYRARHLMSLPDPAGAREALHRCLRISPNYLFLYCLAWLPPLWRFVHREGIKRRLARFCAAARPGELKSVRAPIQSIRDASCR